MDVKVTTVLEYMHRAYNKLSMFKFLAGLFVSEDPNIKKTANMFYSDQNHIKLMDTWWNYHGGAGGMEMVNWVMKKAGGIYAWKLSHLTNRASNRPHLKVAESLRVSSKAVTVADFDLYFNTV